MEKNTDVKIDEKFIEELLKAGTHIGRKKSFGHPNMRPFIFAVRNNAHIINVEKTAQKLDEAVEFLSGIKKRNGTILCVATVMPAKSLIEDFANAIGMPYIKERWIGGTLTNFPEIKRRIDYYLSQLDKKAKGEFEKYTKKEQLNFEDELKTLEKKIGGMKNLTKIPDVLFIVGADEHSIAVEEARKMGVPIVAVVNTNSNPKLVDYPIPANDRSFKSVKLILDKIKEKLS